MKNKIILLLLALFVFVGCDNTKKYSVKDIDEIKSREELSELLNVKESEMDSFVSAINAKLSALPKNNAEEVINDDEDNMVIKNTRFGKQLVVTVTMDNINDILGINTANLKEINAFGEVTKEFVRTGYYNKLFEKGWHIVDEDGFACKFKNERIETNGLSLFEYIESDDKELFLKNYEVVDVKGKLIFEETSACSIVDAIENGYNDFHSEKVLKCPNMAITFYEEFPK